MLLLFGLLGIFHAFVLLLFVTLEQSLRAVFSPEITLNLVENVNYSYKNTFAFGYYLEAQGQDSLL